MNTQGRKIATKFHSYFFFLFSLWQVKIIELLTLQKQSKTRRFNQFNFLVTATTIFICKAVFGANVQAWSCAALTGSPCWKLWQWLLCRDSPWAVAFDDIQGLKPWSRFFIYSQRGRSFPSTCGLIEILVNRLWGNSISWGWGNPLTVCKARESSIKKIENWAWKSGYLDLSHAEPKVRGLR